jgi:hypothetical protein
MPLDVMNRLRSYAAGVVDRREAPPADPAAPLPRADQRGQTGVPARFLAGSPLLGGFGALPVEEHILARHANWAAMFIAACALEPSQQPPWAATLRSLLADLSPPMSPLQVLSVCGQGQAVVSRAPWAAVSRACPCLGHMLHGLAALPPLPWPALPLPVLSDSNPQPSDGLHGNR